MSLVFQCAFSDAQGAIEIPLIRKFLSCSENKLRHVAMVTAFLFNFTLDMINYDMLGSWKGYNQTRCYLNGNEHSTGSENKERVLLQERYNKTEKE